MRNLLVFDGPDSGLSCRRMEQKAKLTAALKGKHTALIVTNDPALLRASALP